VFLMSCNSHERLPTALSAISRRDAIFSGALVAAGLSAASHPAFAASARIKEYPGLEYLEPIYELSLSVKALQSGIQDTAKWPLVLKRLDSFFRGGLVSERNYYGGLSFQYINTIKYDSSELKEYIQLDKDNRKTYMENTLNSLQALKDALALSNKEEIVFNAQQADMNLDHWFSMIPMEDVKAVGRIFKEVRGADIDRDGKLSASELATLPEDDGEVWKKRVALVGE